MAARALVQLYRVEQPQLLKRRDRGKYHTRQADVRQYGEERVLRDLPGAQLLEAEEQLTRPTVTVSRDVATFLEVEEGATALWNDGLPVPYAVGDGKERPMISRRVLSEEDLERMRELRVRNLMQLWNRKRDEVGLQEDRESDGEIDPDSVESETVLRRRRGELLKAQGRSGSQYVHKRKPGGTTNKEKNRMKPFAMSKYGARVMRKEKRSLKLQKMISGKHKQRKRIANGRMARRR